MFDIITFGSAVVDVFVHTNVSEKKDLICYPKGGKILIDNLSFEIGGGGTNTAVAFSRLGLRVGCICNVGYDENGGRILHILSKEGVKFLGRADKHSMSGYSIILDSKGGERTILTYKGVNDDVSFNELDFRKIKSKWLYYSSLLGKSFETQKKLASMMWKKGVKIAFNPSSYLIKNENLFDLLEMCEVLIVNKEEAEDLYKRYRCIGNLLEGLHHLGPKIILVTNKDKEVICFDGEKHYKIKPNKTTKVVERTGAGDAFASGFVAGLVIGRSIQDCLKLGLLESESVIQGRGAKTKLVRMRLKKYA